MGEVIKEKVTLGEEDQTSGPSGEDYERDRKTEYMWEYANDLLDSYKYGLCIVEVLKSGYHVVYANNTLCDMVHLKESDILKINNEYIRNHMNEDDCKQIRDSLKGINSIYASTYALIRLKNNNQNQSYYLKIKKKQYNHDQGESGRTVLFVCVTSIYSNWSDQISESDTELDDHQSVKMCSSKEDIDNFEEEEQEYTEFCKAAECLSKKEIAYYDMNLTRNLCRQKNQNQSTMESIDKLFSSIVDQQYDQEEKSSFQYQFNRENLLQQYYLGNKTVTLQHYQKTLNGHNEWMESTVKMEKNPQTDDIEAIFYTENINKQRLLDGAMSSMIKQKYLSISCLDLNNGYAIMYGTQVNQSQTQIVTYDRDFVAPICVGLVYPEQDEFLESISLEHLRSVMTDQNSFYQLVYKVKGNDGVVRIRKLTVSFMDYRLNLVIITCNDITEDVRKNYENSVTLKKAYDEIKRANQAKTEFLNRMSHDIRTPMNGILGLTSLTLKRNDLTKEVRDNLVEIDSTGKYLLCLVNDSLDISKINNHKLILHLQEHNYLEMINSVVSSIRPLAMEKNIDFQVKVQSCDDVNVITDDLRVKQICINLLSNAVKYTYPGGKVDFIIKKIGQTENISHICIMIKDNGIGMSKEFLPQLFSPFEQENRYDVQNVMGTGLGMTIVKKLVDLLQGMIRVESELGQGTEVTVCLDMKRAERKEAVKDQDTSVKIVDDKVLMDKKVLLCEDNMLNAKIAICILEEKGMKVTHVKNGRQAVDTYKLSKDHEFDVILMDVRMPIMNGLEATKVIRKLSRQDAADVPIIAMTANAFDQDVSECIKTGMNDHIAKPIDVDTLFNKIKKYIMK